MEKVKLSDIIELKKAGFTVSEIMEIYRTEEDKEPKEPKEEPKEPKEEHKEPKEEPKEPKEEPKEPKEPEKDYKKLYEKTLADLKKAQELNVKKEVIEDTSDEEKTLSDIVSSFI